ncbi:MAG: alpha-L-fucosidase [Arachnia sp.]
MHGSLRRLDGGEDQQPGKGVVFSGGAEGVRFDASSLTIVGPDGLVNASFVAEVVFTPAAEQADLAYLLTTRHIAVGYRDGEFVVGFRSLEDGAWTDCAAVACPAAGEEHIFSVAQILTHDGNVVLETELDGELLPYVKATAEQRIGAEAGSSVAFANDVDGAAAGFAGEIAALRVSGSDGAWGGADFLYQRTADAAAAASASFDGTREETYAALEGLTPANYQDVSPEDTDSQIVAKAAMVRPTSRQANFQQELMTAFLHFGPNTFYEQEWGHGTEDPARFDPSEDIDPDSWVRELRDAGFRTAVLTLKHHDGFSLWPTRYSDHSVAGSPWRGGKGDVAAEFAAAARRYGLRVGFYVSPADSSAELKGIYANGSKRTPRTIPTLVEGDDRAGKDIPTFTYEVTDYGQYFLNTLYEVLTQYGEVSEVWFDGAPGNTAATETFDYDAYYDLIDHLQPNANVASGGRDVRWVGNEAGVSRQNEPSVIPIIDKGPGAIVEIQPRGPFNENLGSDAQLAAVVKSGDANKLHWWVTETDMRITKGWFAHPDDVPKSGPRLLEYYEQTVARNSVLLLNIPPTKTGRFAPASVESLRSFASELRRAFTLDHALGAPVTVGDEAVTSITNGNLRDGHWFAATDRTPIVVDLGQERTIARFALREDILGAGMTVASFTVEAEVDGVWTEVAHSGVVGSQRILKLAHPVTARHWRVTVTDARGPYVISAVNLWEELDVDPGKATDVYVDATAPVAGDGSEQRPFTSLEQFRQLELATGATIRFRAGQDYPDADLRFWGYGTDNAPITVTTWAEGSAPTIGGVSLADKFASYAAQGWVVS